MAKKEFHQTVAISPKTRELISDLLGMTGDEIYDKYGYKRDEKISRDVRFSDSAEAEISLVICDGEDKPYTQGVLFVDGCQVTYTDPEDEFLGDWEFEDDEEDIMYFVHVVEEAEAEN